MLSALFLLLSLNSEPQYPALVKATREQLKQNCDVEEPTEVKESKPLYNYRKSKFQAHLDSKKATKKYGKYGKHEKRSSEHNLTSERERELAKKQAQLDQQIREAQAQKNKIMGERLRQRALNRVENRAQRDLARAQSQYLNAKKRVEAIQQKSNKNWGNFKETPKEKETPVTKEE